MRDLLRFGLTATEPWRPEELRARLSEELSSPMQFELANLDRARASRVFAEAQTRGLLLRSLGELFQHAQPPLELLRLAKDYFKLNQSHAQSELPHDLALGLYYTCIAVALWRHGARISQLDRDELRAAFQWVQAQDWLDEASKLAAREATKLIGP